MRLETVERKENVDTRELTDITERRMQCVSTLTSTYVLYLRACILTLTGLFLSFSEFTIKYFDILYIISSVSITIM